jgi:hypothetical protein
LDLAATRPFTANDFEPPLAAAGSAPRTLDRSLPTGKAGEGATSRSPMLGVAPGHPGRAGLTGPPGADQGRQRPTPEVSVAFRPHSGASGCTVWATAQSLRVWPAHAMSVAVLSGPLGCPTEIKLSAVAPTAPGMFSGWVGSVLINIPEWAQYQLAVHLSLAPDGSAVFTSCARPRFSTELMGASKSQRLATSLQKEVWRLVSQG